LILRLFVRAKPVASEADLSFYFVLWLYCNHLAPVTASDATLKRTGILLMLQLRVEFIHQTFSYTSGSNKHEYVVKQRVYRIIV